jgi:hypothetical protein
VIANAETTITIKRRGATDAAADPYDVPTSALTTVATGVPALFTSPAGAEHGAAGSAEAVDWRLLADPCDLRHIDTVVDEVTTRTYAVVWTRARRGVGTDLAHVVAGVNEVKGAA